MAHRAGPAPGVGPNNIPLTTSGQRPSVSNNSRTERFDNLLEHLNDRDLIRTVDAFYHENQLEGTLDRDLLLRAAFHARSTSKIEVKEATTNETGNSHPSAHETNGPQPTNTQQPANHGQPTYTGQPAYTGQPTYAEQPTYAGQPAHNGRSTYHGQSVYAEQPTYVGHSAHNGQPTHGQQPANGRQPTNHQQSANGYQPTHGQQPTTSSQQPTHGQQPTDGYQPTHEQQPTNGHQPTNVYQPTNGQQPTHGQQSTNGQQPTHGQQSTNGQQPTYEQRTTTREPERLSICRPTQITTYEKEAFGRENRGAFSSLTKDTLVILGTCAVGAIMQGWAQESIVGANLNWPQELGIGDYESNRRSLTYFSLVNAAPYFAASLVGVWGFDPLSAFSGRRGVLFAAALCSLAAPIGAAYCSHWAQLLACRAVQGIGMGAKASVIPVLESEIVSHQMRGRLLVLWQTFVAVGVLFGAIANGIFKENWRHQMGIAFVPAVVLLCLCYVIPESPRWLIKKGRYKEAYRVLHGLRETPIQAARDLFIIHIQLRVEPERYNKTSILTGSDVDVIVQHITSAIPEWSYSDFYWHFRELFTIKRNLRAVAGSGAVMMAQQFCGINLFLLLTTTLLSTQDHILWIKLGFAVTMAVFSAPTYFLVDKYGRRPLILISLAAMCILLLPIGHFLDAAGPNPSAGDTGPLVTLIILFIAFYSPGAGVIPFMYSSEVFGQTHREMGMSLAVFINLSLAGVLAMTAPFYEHSWGNKHMTLMGVFFALTIFAFISVWVFMRPTEAATLEDVNLIWKPPLIEYMDYQSQEVIPCNMRNTRRMVQGKDRKPPRSFLEWLRAREQAQ